MSDQQQDRPLSTVDLVNATENREKPMGERQSPAGDNRPMPLLEEAIMDNYRSRWTSIQTSFVDEPRSSVEQADYLVAEVMKQIAQTFADERKKLEDQWGHGDNVSTEDLRLALQRYRSFFNRLLSL